MEFKTLWNHLYLTLQRRFAGDYFISVPDTEKFIRFYREVELAVAQDILRGHPE